MTNNSPVLHVMETLRQSSLFELYRIQVAIDMMLNDPVRLERIKQRLVVGEPVSYFDARLNRLVHGTIQKVNRSTALLLRDHDQHLIEVYFYMLNIDGINGDYTGRSSHGKGLERHQLRVGDQVGFLDKEHKEQFGIIQKLNPKTASILVDGKVRWRVAYQFLFPVVDGQAQRPGAGEHALDVTYTLENSSA